jgi:hypothetical protein
MFALVNLQGRVARLVTVSPFTGLAASIGNTGDSFADLAFDLSGKLYAVTGDGATVPETLFTLSTTNAMPTLVVALGNGDNGEALAFNSVNGLLVHASGRGPQNNAVNGEIFETVNPRHDGEQHPALGRGLRSHGNDSAKPGTFATDTFGICTVRPRASWSSARWTICHSLAIAQMDYDLFDPNPTVSGRRRR